MKLGFDNTSFMISVILLVLIAAAHIFSALLTEKFRELMAIITAILHIGLLLSLYFAGAELRVVLLYLLISVSVYSAVSYTVFRLRGGGDGE